MSVVCPTHVVVEVWARFEALAVGVALDVRIEAAVLTLAAMSDAARFDPDLVRALATPLGCSA